MPLRHHLSADQYVGFMVSERVEYRLVRELSRRGVGVHPEYASLWKCLAQLLRDKLCAEALSVQMFRAAGWAFIRQVARVTAVVAFEQFLAALAMVGQ